MKKSKIALGTAQFGMDYGINNPRGKIPADEAIEILKIACASGIDTVDTASAYGNSEEILGEFVEEHPKALRIVSKLPECRKDEVAKIAVDSLARLHSRGFYGYLIHNFRQYLEEPGIWNELVKLKEAGKAEKIGFSLYYPEELEEILRKKIAADLVQVPFNIFDQRFIDYFDRLKERNIELHVRSVFLQGLMFKKPDVLSGQFLKIKNKIKRLNAIAQKNNLSLVALCLNFAYSDNRINKVVVGIDNFAHFREIISSTDKQAAVRNILPELLAMKEEDENIILPFKWETLKDNAA
jgi:aryl-alcohol dehydrogenase-like predicted oxidoreductase